MTLPQGFIDEITGYRSDCFDGLFHALTQTEPSVSVRINRRKVTPHIIEGCERVPWCEQGYYLPSRPLFTLDPALHQGRYYVQDASSMFVAHAIAHLTSGVDRPLTLLDACAAPGGKTTAAIDSLPTGSMVVANEYVPSRAATLRENLTKWGYPYAMVTQGDTSRFTGYRGIFDIVLADVPCSGEGMMRKDAKAVEQWSPALIEQCVERQRLIIANLWPSIAPGGYLIYSTCTFNRAENEQMIHHIATTYGATPVEIPVDPQWLIAPGIDTPYPCYRFIPGRTRGEGLFMAVLRKPLDADQEQIPSSKPKHKKTQRPSSKPAPIPSHIGHWLSGDYTLSTDEGSGNIIATPIHSLLPAELTPHLVVATPQGRDYAPTHSLAISTALNSEAFATCALERDTALAYLRCQAITLPADTPRGHVLLTYQGTPLGLAKNIGNRANNLYPKPWRILK